MRLTIVRFFSQLLLPLLPVAALLLSKTFTALLLLGDAIVTSFAFLFSFLLFALVLTLLLLLLLVVFLWMGISVLLVIWFGLILGRAPPVPCC